MSVVDARFAVISPAGSYHCVVKAEGEIDIYTGPELRQVLNDALRNRPRTLTVDMADISFMDSTGLNLLVRTFKECQLAGTELVLAAPGPGVLRVMELCGLRKLVRISSIRPGGTQETDV